MNPLGLLTGGWRFRIDNDEILKLHLGCFDQVIPGWINTDITPHIFVARVPGLAWFLYRLGKITKQRHEQHRSGLFRNVRYLDVTKRFPYSDNTFLFVYASHLLEHLLPDQARFCISEIYRVLKPGGVVRIAVPDLDKIIASYDPRNSDFFLESFFEASQKSEKNRHHWYYNAISLKRLLESAGFREIYQCEFGQGRCADVAILDNRPESLFMEAVK